MSATRAQNSCQVKSVAGIVPKKCQLLGTCGENLPCLQEGEREKRGLQGGSRRGKSI